MKAYIVLGDWSDDGHGRTTKVLVDINVSIKEMQDAYKETCKKLDFALDYDQKVGHTLCVEYEDNHIDDPCLTILKNAGCWCVDEWYIGDTDYIVSDDDLTQILIWMVTYSLPHFNCTLLEDTEKIPCFNGYWNNNLNGAIGYGLYY